MELTLSKPCRAVLRGALFVVAALAASWGAERSAAAATELNPPWNASLTAVMGTRSIHIGGGRYVVNTVIVWKRASNGACVTTVLSNALGITTDYRVNGSSADDSLLVVDAGDSASLCGSTIGALNYNGHFVDVYGRGGNDRVEGGAGDTFVFGDEGNDVVTTHGNRLVSGGDGNDLVFADGPSAGGDSLRGGPGDDCLFDASGTAASYDCGTGTGDGAASQYVLPDGSDIVFYPLPAGPTIGCEAVSTASSAVQCFGSSWASAGP